MDKPYFIEFEADECHMIVNLNHVVVVATKDHNHAIYVELSNGKPIVLSSNYPVGEMILRKYKEWISNIGDQPIEKYSSFDFTAWLDECEETFENIESDE